MAKCIDLCWIFLRQFAGVLSRSVEIEYNLVGGVEVLSLSEGDCPLAPNVYVCGILLFVKSRADRLHKNGGPLQLLSGTGFLSSVFNGPSA